MIEDDYFMNEDLLNKFIKKDKFEDAVVIDTEEVDLEFTDKAIYEVITVDDLEKDKGIFIRIGF